MVEFLTRAQPREEQSQRARAYRSSIPVQGVSPVPGAPLAGLDHPWRQASVSVTSETQTKPKKKNPNGDRAMRRRGNKNRSGCAPAMWTWRAHSVRSRPGPRELRRKAARHATRRGHRPAPRGAVVLPFPVPSWTRVTTVTPTQESEKGKPKLIYQRRLG